MQKYQSFLSIFVVFIIINMILYPSLYIQQTLNGISAWAFNVLPSVLPFIFFTKVITSLGTIEKVSQKFGYFTKKLFNTPHISSFVFFTSIISGYPVGAKMTSDLYQSGKISREDAFKMCSFCSTSGPMFIVGAVGVGMLGNSTYGYIILISHILGAILNGIIFRKLKIKDSNHRQEISYKPQSTKPDLSEIVLDSSLSIISVGSIIAIFFVIITALAPAFSIFPPPIASLLEGIIEITKGCTDIATTFKSVWGLVACTFVISFGGISTILQSVTMLSKLKMPIGLFILQKLSHAVLSALFSILIVLFFL